METGKNERNTRPDQTRKLVEESLRVESGFVSI